MSASPERAGRGLRYGPAFRRRLVKGGRNMYRAACRDLLPDTGRRIGRAPEAERSGPGKCRARSGRTRAGGVSATDGGLPVSTGHDGRGCLPGGQPIRVCPYHARAGRVVRARRIVFFAGFPQYPGEMARPSQGRIHLQRRRSGTVGALPHTQGRVRKCRPQVLFAVRRRCCGGAFLRLRRHGASAAAACGPCRAGPLPWPD